MRVLCFDVGGTTIKYALIEDKLEDIEVKEIPTRKTETENYILKDILDLISTYSNLDAIGVSSAGVVDYIKGEIAFAGPTIPGYMGTKIKESIEKKYNIPCFVENDVNSAAYGEYIYGKYEDSMFCMTIGTGVGGSLILNNEIFRGNSMTAGEIGYIPLNGGHFQEYASATFLTQYVSDKIGKKVDGKYIFENCKKGDALCSEAIDTLIDNLCYGILNIIYILNPKTIVIGGGITAQGNYLEEKILKALDSKIMGKQFKTDIKLAKLKNSAGIYGIYYIVRKELS